MSTSLLYHTCGISAQERVWESGGTLHEFAQRAGDRFGPDFVAFAARMQGVTHDLRRNIPLRVQKFGADVMILPELWRSDEGHDFFEDLRSSLHVDGGFAPLAHGERVTSGVGDGRVPTTILRSP